MRPVNRRSNVTNKQKNLRTLDIVPLSLCPAIKSSDITISGRMEDVVLILCECTKTLRTDILI